MTRAYEEIVDFIAAGSTSADVANWSPSSEARDHAAYLLAAEKQGTLSPHEKDELQHYLELEHIMRLAKARARKAASP